MVHLLWTGGWDSTFRLLQLARSGAVVQPHYIREPSRLSAETEILVMQKIRDKVNSLFENCCIHDVEIFCQSEIIVSDEFKKAHKNLSSRGWIGCQYIHIASYCKQIGIKGMELSIERASQSNQVRDFIPTLYNTELDKRNNRIISRNSDKNLQCLFGQFFFPILSLTKLDMLKIAEEWGLTDILNMTWFCHQPFFGKPCGSCNPCIHTLEDGLRYRFAFSSLVRYRLKKLLISHPKAHLFLRKLKYGSIDYS